jgi:hypothetical protein
MVDGRSAAFGIFSDRLSTENAIETLRAAGFRNTDISSLFPDDLYTSDTAGRKTKALRGAVAGATAGAIVFGALGWLTGTGALAVPEQLALLAVAPMATSLASLGAGTALGSLVGAWAGRRIPEYKQHYEGRVRRGDILISVRCVDPPSARKAMQILKRTGAEDIASNKTADFPRTRTTSPPITRPVRKETVLAPLRLVVNRTLEPGTSNTTVPRSSNEAGRPEVRKRSAAS